MLVVYVRATKSNTGYLRMETFTLTDRSDPKLTTLCVPNGKFYQPTALSGHYGTIQYINSQHLNYLHSS